jgi:predicted Na+-dependent transporter
MQFIRKYFGLLLLLSCMIGMVVPSFGDITPRLVMIALAFIIFCSFFQIEFSLSALAADFTLSLQFYLIRFVLMPVVVFFVLKWFSEFYALLMLLIFLLPAAVSSPSFTILFGGKPDLSLKILVYSSFLSVVSIPLIMGLLPGALVKVNAGQLLMTMVYTIVLPFLIHLPLRKISRVHNTIARYNALFTLLGLGTIFIAATARNKPAILGNPALVGLYAVIAILLYFILYWIGYMLMPTKPRQARVTMSISSGANNIGLGVTITALFFPGNMNVFFIVAQLAWVIALIPLRKIFRTEQGRIRD